MGHLGFSYIGLIWLALLFAPNLMWARKQPQGYEAAGESKWLRALERVGQVGVTCTALLFSDFNVGPLSPRILWLAGSFVLLMLYEAWWVRYFKSRRTLDDFYSSFCGLPVAGATLPVLAFFLLGLYGRVVWLLAATAVLAVGHIGIHLQHRRAL